MSTERFSRGEIITFYSYKGGTGRTMALANVACLLAERAKGSSVLVVDWDLEAPGLHRYFPSRLVSQQASFDTSSTGGVIDLLSAIEAHLPSQPAESEEASEAALKAVFETIDPLSFVSTTNVPGVSIMRAGRDQDQDYSRRVSTFEWEKIFRRAPTIYRGLAERLAGKFEYVLIDSRTGVTDISGICTSLLPERLVLVFTPNRQSLLGLQELTERATSYRRNSDDLRPLLIHPLPSRIEASREDLRVLWRFGSRDQHIIGYQPMFEEIFTRTYGLGHCDLSAYFDEIQIQQSPDYAYGEEIAVRRTTDRLSLAHSYRIFVDFLVTGKPPWAYEGGQGDDERRTQDAVQAMGKVLASAETFSKSSRVSSGPAGRPVIIGSNVDATGPRSSAERDGLDWDEVTKVFISAAEVDRRRVAPIVESLESRGYFVWNRKLQPGVDTQFAIAQAIDDSDVVVACWTKDSVTSETVVAEAEEASRRGILIPALLDDVTPPLSFRSIVAADLRRDFDGGVEKLAAAIARIPRATPGVDRSEYSVEASRPSDRKTRYLLTALLAAVLIVPLVVLVTLYLSSRAGRGTSPPISKGPSKVDRVRVPDFVGREIHDAEVLTKYLGLQAVVVDETGTPASLSECTIQRQTPAAESLAARGTVLQLTCAPGSEDEKSSTRLVLVPSIVGSDVGAAARKLAAAGLQLDRGVLNGKNARGQQIVIHQSPPPETLVVPGTEVHVKTGRPRGRTDDPVGNAPK